MNIEKYRKSFQKISGKISEDFEKYFRNFREVGILENFVKF